MGSSHGGPNVTQPVHSVGYHFSQSSFALIGLVEHELEEDEVEDDMALDVVKEGADGEV